MIFISPLSIVVYLTMLGIDICLFFLIVRLFVLWGNPAMLEGLDRAGSSLVNGIATCIGNGAERITHRPLSEQGKVAASMAVLSLMNLLLKQGLTTWFSG